MVLSTSTISESGGGIVKTIYIFEENIMKIFATIEVLVFLDT